MPDISLIIDGHEQAVPAGTTGTTWFERSHDIVAIEVDDTPRNLETPFEAGATIEAITLANEDGLNILRHSATHVLAQAVQDVLPGVNLSIKPFIADGFYHDFGNIDTVIPELLRNLEKRMKRIVKEGQHFVRREISEEETVVELAEQPYKLELVTTKGKSTKGVSVRVGGGTPTMYDNVRRDDSVAWKDLYRGLHLSSTKLIGNGFALTKTSAAYWKGDQAGDQLQRIYGTTWASKEDPVAYQEHIKEVERHDRRCLDAKLDLCSSPEEIGPGLAVFHPKGGILHHEIESYVTDRHRVAGFDFVHTPEISKDGLFHMSGHLPCYADTMFPPMFVDEERNKDNNVTKAGQEYYLKAMSCPMYGLIFHSHGRSCCKLPLRFYELGHNYRYEKNGVVHDSTHIRGFTQDDSHIYYTPEQTLEEIRTQTAFFLLTPSAFGLEDFYLELSTRDEDDKKKDKFIGSGEDWATATKALEDACAATGLDLVPDPGGATSYDPKVSVQVKDAVGRTWQMSTIQYDFNQPDRFDLGYTATDNSRQRPIMIHSAKLGSVGRFIGVLTEHYAGASPAWLSPVQVRLIPVAEAFDGHVKGVATKLCERGVRVETDLSDDRFSRKIRNTSKDRIPFTFIAGGEDVETGAVPFRLRDGSQHNGVAVNRAVKLIVSHIEQRNDADQIDGLDEA